MDVLAQDAHQACPTEGSARIQNAAPAVAAHLAKTKAATIAAPAAPLTLDASVSIVPGTVLQGAAMRAAFVAAFPFTCLADIDCHVRDNSAQLPMLLDQLPATLRGLSPEALATLQFAGIDLRSTTANVRVRVCDLAVVKGFVPHRIEKSPTSKKTPEYKRWQSFTPPECLGLAVDRNIFAFVGQFPMALSAEAISDVFYTATGIRPLLVDHLPKGAKVFLRSTDEVRFVTRWSQTVQVTEFGSLFTASPASTEEECATSQTQLLMMRKEVDAKFKRLAARRHDPYSTTLQLQHSKEKLKQMAVAEKKVVSVVRPGPNDRNGTYPMTIEIPKASKSSN